MSYWHGQALKYSPSKHDWPAGARRGSGVKDSPNGAYRSEGPCRHNMPYIFCDFKTINEVVFEDTKI